MQHARSIVCVCLIAPCSALLGLSALKSQQSWHVSAPATTTRLDLSKKLVTELDTGLEIKRQCIELGIVRELRMPGRGQEHRQGLLNRLWLPISALPQRIVRLPFRASKTLYRATEHGLAGYDILSNVSLAKYPIVRFAQYPVPPAVVR